MLKTTIALILASLFISAAEAAITFTASVTNANGSLATKLTWSAPGATGCTASGHTSWAGAKPASGTLDLPAITLSGTYNLKIGCTFPTATKAKLAWTKPTKNTDGTNMTDLSGYSIHYGKSADMLSTTVLITNPTVVNTEISVLSSGAWYYGIRALRPNGVQSDMSNIVSKTFDITATTTEEQSVTLTVNPIPLAISDLIVN